MKITVTNSKSPIGISSVNVVRYESETKSDPYLFRSSPDVATHRKTLSELEGGTVAWNQLIVNSDFSTTASGVSASRTNGLFTLSGTASSDGWITRTEFNPSVINGHVYAFLPSKILANGIQFGGLTTAGLARSDRPSIYKATASATATSMQIRIETTKPWNDSFYIGLFDLTLMFGSSIADYVYTLEQANAGSGIAWLKSYGYFTKDYYPYDSGSLVSVKTSGAKMVGFNAWDEEWENGDIDSTTGANTTNASLIRSKNYIPMLPNTSYYFHCGTSGVNTVRARFYDAGKNYIGYTDASGIGITPQNSFTTRADCAYMRFAMPLQYGATYNNDICINLAWDNSRNGEYKPYISQTYPISDIELRGIPTLDNGKIKYDGDTYAPDGTVTRYYGTRAYQSGDENDPTVITDMTTTVYKLTTPTTETTDPYTSTQWVDKWGTEEFIDERTVPMPVGNETVYQTGRR